MGFVSGNKAIQKTISHSGGLAGKTLQKTSKNSLTTGTNLMGGISESKCWTLSLWYKHSLEIILQAFNQEMIRFLGKEFLPSLS